jgi:hypothetical protein
VKAGTHNLLADFGTPLHPLVEHPARQPRRCRNAAQHGPPEPPMTFPHPDSLYTLLANVQSMQTEGGRFFNATVSALTQEKGLTIDRYQKLRNDNMPHLSHGSVTDLIFAEANDQHRARCIGPISRKDFEETFESGLNVYGENAERLAMVFMFTSFPETYFHPQIAEVLCQSGKLMNKEAAKTRISDTALIMLQAVNNSPLATIALVASSHMLRQLKGNANYNENTVEFTLLTFSYFGAKRSGVKSADWFFYWKMFGSLMGLGPDRLHDSFDVAGSRMKELHKACTLPPSPNSQALLDVFISTMKLKKEEQIRELNAYGVVSKRLWEYLRLKKLWPDGLARSSDIPTD